jgi:hypothetical protein
MNTQDSWCISCTVLCLFHSLNDFFLPFFTLHLFTRFFRRYYFFLALFLFVFPSHHFFSSFLFSFIISLLSSFVLVSFLSFSLFVVQWPSVPASSSSPACVHVHHATLHMPMLSVVQHDEEELRRLPLMSSTFRETQTTCPSSAPSTLPVGSDIGFRK